MFNLSDAPSLSSNVGVSRISKCQRHFSVSETDAVPAPAQAKGCFLLLPALAVGRWLWPAFQLVPSFLIRATQAAPLAVRGCLRALQRPRALNAGRFRFQSLSTRLRKKFSQPVFLQRNMVRAQNSKCFRCARPRRRGSQPIRKESSVKPATVVNTSPVFGCKPVVPNPSSSTDPRI